MAEKGLQKARFNTIRPPKTTPFPGKDIKFQPIARRNVWKNMMSTHARTHELSISESTNFFVAVLD